MARTADDVTRSLCEWVEFVLPDVPVAVRSLAEPDPRKGIDIRLLTAIPVPMPRTDRSTATLRLDYLATITLDDPLAEHRCLGELLFAAVGHADLQVMPAEQAARMRGDFKLPGATGIVFSLQLRREREVTIAPLVRRPLVVEGTGIRPLAGIVLGPDDTPVADAIVELPALNLSAITDHRGRFAFAGTPANGPLRLTATKNRVKVGLDTSTDGPVTIRIPMEG